MRPRTNSLLSNDAIARGLADYGFEATNNQVAQISRYVALLLLWNEKVNITAIRDPHEILFRHFGESIWAAFLANVKSGRLADVGSGGGFPGLPIKIAVPDLELVLIEPNAKRATFLAEVIRELGLSRVQVLVRPYQELGEEIAPIEYVCARALGDYESLLTWAALPTTSANTALLWLGRADVEGVTRVAGWDWQEPVAIPHSLRRFLLIGRRRR